MLFVECSSNISDVEDKEHKHGNDKGRYYKLWSFLERNSRLLDFFLIYSSMFWLLIVGKYFYRFLNFCLDCWRYFNVICLEDTLCFEKGLLIFYALGLYLNRAFFITWIYFMWRSRDWIDILTIFCWIIYIWIDNGIDNEIDNVFTEGWEYGLVRD